MSIRRLKAWADEKKRDRYFDVRYIARSPHPWGVVLSDDTHSWTVYEACHDSLKDATDRALARAETEEKWKP